MSAPLRPVDGAAIREALIDSGELVPADALPFSELGSGLRLDAEAHRAAALDIFSEHPVRAREIAQGTDPLAIALRQLFARQASKKGER